MQYWVVFYIQAGYIQGLTHCFHGWIESTKYVQTIPLNLPTVVSPLNISDRDDDDDLDTDQYRTHDTSASTIRSISRCAAIPASARNGSNDSFSTLWDGNYCSTGNINTLVEIVYAWMFSIKCDSLIWSSFILILEPQLHNRMAVALHNNRRVYGCIGWDTKIKLMPNIA